MFHEFSGASKIVFILITLTLCAGFLFGKLPTESFLVFASMVFAYYFTRTNPNGNGDKVE